MIHPLFEHKEAAVSAFKAADFDIALEHYSSAIKIGESLGKTNTNIQDLDPGHDLNYEMAALKYNTALIYYKQHDYLNTVRSCEEAFAWMEKIEASPEEDLKYEKLRNFVENKYYVSLLKNGNYCKVAGGLKNIKRCKELDTMYERINYDEFGQFYNSLSAQDKYTDSISKKIMGIGNFTNFKTNDIIINNDIFKDILFHFIKNENLPGHLILSILKIGYKSMTNQDNIQFVKNKRAYVFGDTHGQFFDTLAVLSDISGNSLDLENGLILDENAVFIFNGDFVDRGAWGIENFIMLMILKILYPNQIFLNRGNHEFEAINIQFGFMNEIFKKYGLSFEPLFRAFETTFTTLPLCTVLNNEYFIVHGGLPRYTTLSEIMTKNRFVKGTTDEVISGLMWSDPDDIDSWRQSNRGCGIIFGRDITSKFLSENNLKKIIRSHEFVENGYRENHNGLVNTIFSSPNYCGSFNNASYIEIMDGKYSVIQYGEWTKNGKYKKFIDDVRQQ